MELQHKNGVLTVVNSRGETWFLKKSGNLHYFTRNRKKGESVTTAPPNFKVKERDNGVPFMSR